MRIKHEAGAGRARRPRVRYLLAMVLATVMGLGLALPAFGAQEPDLQPQIVGGDPVPTGKYQFIAALRDTTRGSTAYEQQFCGGSLIDANSVLTAAHCVQGQVRQPLRVTVGRTTLNNENEGQTRQVTNIAIHPRYNGVTNEAYDAAVLTLGSNVTGIAPVRIPATTSNGFETPGRSATIAGWGNTIKQGPGFSQPDSYPNRMQEAQVPIVSDSTGERVYTTSYFPTLMVAAGREGKDTCQGDSGGPIFFRTQTARYQVGITSFGAGCGARGFPGVYAETNAGPIRNFIFNAAN